MKRRPFKTKIKGSSVKHASSSDAPPTSSGIWIKEDKRDQISKKKMSLKEGQMINTDFLCSYLIDSKANGVHVLTMAPISAPVLLHESY